MATTQIHPIHLWPKKYLVHLVIVSSSSEIYHNTYVHVNHWTSYHHRYSNTHPNFHLFPSYNSLKLDFQFRYPRGLHHRFSTTMPIYSHIPSNYVKFNTKSSLTPLQ
jgi:hypothetical protein